MGEITNTGKNVEKLDLSYIAGGNVKSFTILERTLLIQLTMKHATSR